LTSADGCWEASDRTSAYIQPKLTYAIAFFVHACDRSRTTGEPALGVLAPDMGVLQHMLVFECEYYRIPFIPSWLENWLFIE
jgi:hypothetical protein